MNRKIVIIIILFVLGISTIFLIEQYREVNFQFSGNENNNTNLQDKNIVYYAYMTNVDYIKKKFEKASTLPNQLIIKPGNYEFNNLSYKLDKEGFYRFILPQKFNQQRIVFDGNIDALMSGVAWIYAHGNIDNGKSIEELNRESMSRKLIATCGGVSNWITSILSEHNIKSRVVSTLTLDEWNSYDNGHTMIEVYDEDLNKWILYDLDSNSFFVTDEKKLSLIEFVDAVKNDDYQIRFLSSDTKTDLGGFSSSSGYDYSLLYEGVFSNEDNIRKWHDRVIQVPMIKHEGEKFFYNLENKERISSYSNIYKYLDKKEFMKKFYGNSEF